MGKWIKLEPSRLAVVKLGKAFQEWPEFKSICDIATFFCSALFYFDGILEAITKDPSVLMGHGKEPLPHVCIFIGL